MKIKNIAVGEATVVLTSDELAFLCSAIGETLETVEEWEFRTRTGETRERAREIQLQFGSIYDKTEKQS